MATAAHRRGLRPPGSPWYPQWAMAARVVPGDEAALSLPGTPAGAGRAVLLLHGFTGSPFEMRPLGEALGEAGLAVSAPALPGHGADAARLRAVRWTDYTAAVERAFDALAGSGRPVGVVGLSMGGLLALHLALVRPAAVGALGLLATALWLPPWPMRGVRRIARSPWLGRLSLPKLGRSDIADREMRRRNPSRSIPLSALTQLVAGMDAVRPRLAEVRAPALIAHGALDHTIPPACSEALVAELGGEVERFALPRSFHVVTLDVEREALFARLSGFLFARLPPAR
jgi:carboxylesterase